MKFENIQEIKRYFENLEIPEDVYGTFMIELVNMIANSKKLKDLSENRNAEELNASELENVAGGLGNFSKKMLASSLGVIASFSATTPTLAKGNYKPAENMQSSILLDKNSSSKVELSKEQKEELSKLEEAVKNLSPEEKKEIASAINEVSKEIKEKNLEKYVEIHKSKDGNWLYAFNQDGENTITLIKNLSKSTKKLNSTIDNHKITRISGEMAHLGTLLKVKTLCKLSGSVAIMLGIIMLFPLSIFANFAVNILELVLFQFTLMAFDGCNSKEDERKKWIELLFPLTIGVAYLFKSQKESFKKTHRSISGKFELEEINLEYCKSISEGCFKNCHNLKLVRLPNCEEIGDSAFENCEKLEEFIAPKCKKLGNKVFTDYKKIKNINIEILNKN